MTHVRVFLAVMLVAACGERKPSFGSICDGSDQAPSACGTACDPLPGAPTTCPAGFHCSPDGTCDAQCTPGGAECGEGYACTADGYCVDDSGNGSGSGSGSGSGGISEACRHIDVVIAVDNSGSMQEEKTALRDIAFPGFAQALINVAGGIDDFRVGVLEACPDPASYNTSGVTGPCNFQGGKVWMESSSTALVDEFKCVGNVSSAGTNCSGDNDDEQPVTAATASLEAMYQGTGMPNAGFLRQNALLVVVAITDEDEQPVPNASAQQIYDRLVAVKGDVKRMVLLGIGGASACAGAYGTAKHATKLQAITALFSAQQRGVFWDLCQGNLDQGLTAALQTIEQACRELPPIL
jgi:hypothetical protein